MFVQGAKVSSVASMEDSSLLADHILLNMEYSKYGSESEGRGGREGRSKIEEAVPGSESGG